MLEAVIAFQAGARVHFNFAGRCQKFQFAAGGKN
jgi:hypothetical protein